MTSILPLHGLVDKEGCLATWIVNAVCCVYGSSSRLVLLLVFDAAAEAEEAEQEAFGVCGSRERCQGLEGKRNLMGALVPQLESKGDVSLLVLKAYILSLFFLVVALFLAVGDAWIQYAEFYAMSSFSSNLTQHYLDFSLMV
uniref:Uncharacterized protein n=1 Tax=Physcomitrium patens TaxID=3218 RepID=A0A7I4D0A1_PHYPA